jgi:CspA family cold shock protein
LKRRRRVALPSAQSSIPSGRDSPVLVGSSDAAVRTVSRCRQKNRDLHASLARILIDAGTPHVSATYAIQSHKMSFAMPAGAVRFFNVEKGFGFISPTDGREDIFVHITAIERSGLTTVNAGDFLEFDVERDKRTGKFIATNLELISQAGSE